MTTNAAMDAGGLVVEVVQPMVEIGIRFAGEVSVLADPRVMRDPKSALTSSPLVSAQVHLRYRAIAAPHEQTFESAGQSFAPPNHYEQLCAVTGRLEIGGAHAYEVLGAWPARPLLGGAAVVASPPWFYRWLHGCTAEFGFMAAYFGDPDGSSRCGGGFVFDGADVHRCDDVTITTVRDQDGFQQRIDVTLVAGGERRWRLRGEALSSVPLRHRSADGSASTRIVESAIRWHREGEGELYGMAEYLDQIHDGQPVGEHV